MIKVLYTWSYKGFKFQIKKRWNNEALQYLRKLRHDIKDAQKYWYYVNHDPYANTLIQFCKEIILIGQKQIDLKSPKRKLEFLLSFVQHLNYYKEEGEYPKYPMETIMDKGGDCEDTAILMAFIAREIGYDTVLLEFLGTNAKGDWGHIDLGIAEKYKNEFSGTYWKKNGKRFYFTSCNGIGFEIGEYVDKLGTKAILIPGK